MTYARLSDPLIWGAPAIISESKFSKKLEEDLLFETRKANQIALSSREKNIELNQTEVTQFKEFCIRISEKFINIKAHIGTNDDAKIILKLLDTLPDYISSPKLLSFYRSYQADIEQQLVKLISAVGQINFWWDFDVKSAYSFLQEFGSEYLQLVGTYPRIVNQTIDQLKLSSLSHFELSDLFRPRKSRINSTRREGFSAIESKFLGTKAFSFFEDKGLTYHVALVLDLYEKEIITATKLYWNIDIWDSIGILRKYQNPLDTIKILNYILSSHQEVVNIFTLHPTVTVMKAYKMLIDKQLELSSGRSIEIHGFKESIIRLNVLTQLHRANNYLEVYLELNPVERQKALSAWPAASLEAISFLARTLRSTAIEMVQSPLGIDREKMLNMLIELDFLKLNNPQYAIYEMNNLEPYHYKNLLSAKFINIIKALPQVSAIDAEDITHNRRGLEAAYTILNKGQTLDNFHYEFRQLKPKGYLSYNSFLAIMASLTLVCILLSCYVLIRPSKGHYAEHEIKSLKPADPIELLSEDEMENLRTYIETIQDTKIKKATQEELIEYLAYLNARCAFTTDRINTLTDPVTIEALIRGTHNNTVTLRSWTRTYDRAALIDWISTRDEDKDIIEPETLDSLIRNDNAELTYYRGLSNSTIEFIKASRLVLEMGREDRIDVGAEVSWVRSGLRH